MFGQFAVDRRVSIHSARRTLVTLGVIVLQADLEPLRLSAGVFRVGWARGLLDGLQEVTLLGLIAVVEQLSNVLAHTGWKAVSFGVAKVLIAADTYRR